MNYVTHFPNPEQQAGNYIQFYCGLHRHISKDKYIVSKNPEDITCIKCKKYLNNPFRALRKYGAIKVYGDQALTLNGTLGNHIDITAMKQPDSALWSIIAKIGDEIIWKANYITFNIKELAFMILSKLETELNLKPIR